MPIDTGNLTIFLNLRIKLIEMKKLIVFLLLPLVYGCNAINSGNSYFTVTVKGQTFVWSGNSSTSMDGRATYLKNSGSTCSGYNAVQLIEGSVASTPNFNCSFFVPDGEGTFIIGNSSQSCFNMTISGPWAYPLVSGYQTTNGTIAYPKVIITEETTNFVKGTIEGTIAESNQDGTFSSRTISGSFKLKKL
jgi:hypothetical protein